MSVAVYDESLMMDVRCRGVGYAPLMNVTLPARQLSYKHHT